MASWEDQLTDFCRQTDKVDLKTYKAVHLEVKDERKSGNGFI